VPGSEAIERPERDTVVPLELFFDLVFVCAFTQVTTLLSREQAVAGWADDITSAEPDGHAFEAIDGRPVEAASLPPHAAR
jgi:hypothetical protein